VNNWTCSHYRKHRFSKYKFPIRLTTPTHTLWIGGPSPKFRHALVLTWGELPEDVYALMEARGLWWNLHAHGGFTRRESFHRSMRDLPAYVQSTHWGRSKGLGLQ
jgi:hypothetical protein